MLPNILHFIWTKRKYFVAAFWGRSGQRNRRIVDESGVLTNCAIYGCPNMVSRYVPTHDS
jgi:hypothetical protein